MTSATTKHVEHIRTYVIIYVMLISLLLATVIAAIFDFGVVGLLIAMGIAVAKALLVILFFMHVRHSSHVTWVFAGAAFLWLGILLVLTMNDYATRPPDVRHGILNAEPAVGADRRPARYTQ